MCGFNVGRTIVLVVLAPVAVLAARPDVSVVILSVVLPSVGPVDSVVFSYVAGLAVTRNVSVVILSVVVLSVWPVVSVVLRLLLL